MATKSTYHKFETRHRLPDPKTSVLLVIDMQNHFIPTAEPILPAVTTTIHLCKRAGIPVILTRHRHQPGDDGGVLGEWWDGDIIVDGPLGSHLIPEVVSAATSLPGKVINDWKSEGEVLGLSASLAGKVMNDGKVDVEIEVVEKNTYSAFRNTGLEERLVELGVKEVIITGVMTNLCCETTARDAFIRGFRVFFSTDATATSSPELHDATLMNMAYGFAYLVDCPRLKSAF